MSMTMIPTTETTDVATEIATAQTHMITTTGTNLYWYGVGGGSTSTTGGLILPYPTTGTAGSMIQIHRVDSGLNGAVYVTGTSSTTANIVYHGSGSYVTITSGYITGGNGQHWNPQPFKSRRGPLIKKSIKSSIKRALRLMANFGMEEDARIFLSGNEIEVSHPDSKFKFVLSMSKYRGLLGATEHPGHSTPYDLSLYTKTDVHIADLCVYMDKTPVLDQILALSMFVKTGNENDLLEKANFRALSSDIELRQTLALGCPMLESKLRTNSVRVQ